MIKIKGEDGAVFYFETEEHLNSAILGGSVGRINENNLSFLQLSCVALNNESGKVLKCRYDMETLIDILRGEE